VGQFRRLLPQATKVTNPTLMLSYFGSRHTTEKVQSLNQPQRLYSTAFIVQVLQILCSKIALHCYNQTAILQKSQNPPLVQINFHYLTHLQCKNINCFDANIEKVQPSKVNITELPTLEIALPSLTSCCHDNKLDCIGGMNLYILNYL